MSATTTRVSPKYRRALEQLRAGIDKHCQAATPAYFELHALADEFSYLLGMGFPPKVEVPLEQAREDDGIARLLDDTATVTDSDRDHRPVAAE